MSLFTHRRLAMDAWKDLVVLRSVVVVCLVIVQFL
jgi:hypothetical protein